MRHPKTFDEAREFLSEIPHINEGGCAVAAYAMYKWLKKRNAVDDFQIIYVYGAWGDEDSYRTNYARLIEHDDNAAMRGCGHALFRYHGKVWDVDEEMDPDDYYRTLEIPTDQLEELMPESLTADKAWNPCFDRKHYSNIIEEVMQIKFDVPNFNDLLCGEDYCRLW